MPSGSEALEPVLCYLDTSALVKLVIDEGGSAAMATLATTSRGVASALVRTEVPRAVMRRRPAALDRVPSMLAAVDLLDIDDEILHAAATLGPPSLRSLDAIHLATALRLAGGLTSIVTYDTRMAEAARLLGFRVEAPA